jgi:hypothetical protein
MSSPLRFYSRRLEYRKLVMRDSSRSKDLTTVQHSCPLAASFAIGREPKVSN